MLTLGIVLGIGAYGVASYGVVLLKGWDISLKQWFSPVHPYQWPPAGQPVPTVDDTRIWPAGSAGNAGADGGGGGSSGPPAGGQGTQVV